MISDCGNKIDSVKFTVWAGRDGKGWVEVAWDSKSRPAGTSRNDWKRRYYSNTNLLIEMNKLATKVRLYEATEPVRMYCAKCNTVTIFNRRF